MNPWETMLRYGTKRERRIVGLMSGTSLDGVDAVLVRIAGSGRETQVVEEAFVTLPFPSPLRERVLAICHGQGQRRRGISAEFSAG